MPGVPAGATPPDLSDAEIARLSAHAPGLIGRLNAGEPLGEIAADLSRQAGVTQGQVVTYARALAELGPAAPKRPSSAVPPPPPPPVMRS